MTDLSDSEWQLIEPHLPVAKSDDRPRKHHLREILDSIFYITRSGCAWRLLPNDLPPWKTVYHYFIRLLLINYPTASISTANHGPPRPARHDGPAPALKLAKSNARPLARRRARLTKRRARRA